MTMKKIWFRLDLYDPRKKNKLVTSSWYPTHSSAMRAKSALISTPYGMHNFKSDRGGVEYSVTQTYGGWIVKGPIEDKDCQFV